VNIPNLLFSLQVVDFELFQKTHDCIHEFIYLAGLSYPSQFSWLSKSAFLTYHYVAYDQAHRSLLEALAGYYNAANILLRSVLELVLKGAFWECLSRKRFREKADIIESKATVKIEGSVKTIVNWLQDVIELKPEIGQQLEENSASVFDKISPIFEDDKLKKLIPTPKIVIDQLSAWGILDPYEEKEIYDFYQKLSAEVHVVPDKIDLGRRLLHEKELFEVELMPEELKKFLKLLQKIMDISTVIELNVLSDWIAKNKNKLKERLPFLETLGLEYSSRKLLKLVQDER
jgi:hypothetical protein